MNMDDLNGKSIALVLMGEDATGEDDCAVFRGTAQCAGTDLHFVRDGVDFCVPAETLDRIRPTNPEVKDILLEAPGTGNSWY